MLNRNQLAFVKAAEKVFGVGSILTREEIDIVINTNKLSFPYWFTTKSEYRAGRGQYKLPNIGTNIVTEEPEMEVALAAQVLEFKQPKLIDDSDVSIPVKYPDYVPFGFYKDLTNIINSGEFYPVFITGLSGNGKTLMVEQVCATLGRECIRVNVSIETDDTDLLGGPTLVNGNALS